MRRGWNGQSPTAYPTAQTPTMPLPANRPPPCSGVTQAALPQRASGVALGDGLDVVGADDLDVVPVVVFEDAEGVAALIGQRDGAPLLHAGAGHAFAIAILGIIGFGVPHAAHIGVEQLGSQALHHGKHRAPPHIRLIHPRRVGNVKAVAPAGVPFGPDAVQRQTDLRDNVGAQGLFRPGKRAHPIASRREKWYTDFILV